MTTSTYVVLVKKRKVIYHEVQISSFQEKKTSNVKYEDSDSDDDLESLSNFLSGPSTMTTPMTRRSAGGMLDLSELDPVEELAAEHLEDSP